MKIYITRHGETEWNKEGRMQGWKNSNLSKEGIESSKNLGERLKDINFDYIYCSSLERTLDTAKYIRGNKNTEIIKIDSLKEMGFGKWEGMEFKDIKESYPLEYSNYWERPHLYNTVEGESFEDFFKRVQKALDQIIKKSHGKNVLVVSHGVVIKAIYSIINNKPLENLWDPPFITNNSLSVVEIVDNELKIKFIDNELFFED